MAIGLLFGALLTGRLLMTYGRVDQGGPIRRLEEPIRPSSQKNPDDETRAPPAGLTTGARPAARAEEVRLRPDPADHADRASGERTPLPPAGPMVTVRIASAPSGVAVVESRTGRVAGQTPFETAVPLSEGQLDLTLRKRGYRLKHITVDLAGNTDLDVALDKHAAARPSAPDDADEDRRKL